MYASVRCILCDLGKYQTGWALPSTLQFTESGTYQTGPGVVQSKQCAVCNTGTYETGSGISQSIDCMLSGSGSYQTGSGISSSVLCMLVMLLHTRLVQESRYQSVVTFVILVLSRLGLRLYPLWCWKLSNQVGNRFFCTAYDGAFCFQGLARGCSGKVPAWGLEAGCKMGPKLQEGNDTRGSWGTRPMRQWRLYEPQQIAELCLPGLCWGQPLFWTIEVGHTWPSVLSSKS